LSFKKNFQVGDGTTSVIVLAGEALAVAQPFLNEKMHPTVIIRAYRQALEDMINVLQDQIAISIDLKDDEQVREVIKACIGTKFMSQWSDLAVNIADTAVKTVYLEENGRKEIDIKRYAKVEKIPGGRIEDSYVLKGIMLNKDVTHQKMKRRIEKPRIILLDCPLEYKKGESMTNVEMMKEEDFTKMLQLEEEFVQKMCQDIINMKPDLIFTEKGISDLAQHFLVKVISLIIISIFFKRVFNFVFFLGRNHCHSSS
jgi:T-complex protein 1 subunit gamma